MWNFFIQLFRARLKTAVSPSFAAAFLMFPAVILALGTIFNQDNSLKIKIGVLEAATPVALQILENLRQYNISDCEITVYDDEAQMQQDVAARKLECAYVFTPAVESFQTDGAVITYRSPMTLTNNVTDLLIAAAYVETMAGTLGASVLVPYLPEMTAAGTDTEIDAKQMAAEIQSLAEQYLQRGTLMEMTLMEIGQAQSESIAPYFRLFHGLTGLFALLLAWLCAMGFSNETERAVLKRIKSTGMDGGIFVMAGFCVIFMVVAVFLAVTLLGGELLYPGLSAPGAAEWVMGFTYAIALAGLAMLLAAVVREDFFPAVISFMFIFSALLGGTFFELREIIADIHFLRYFFVNHYYLEGINRAGGGLSAQPLALLAVGVVSGAAAMQIARHVTVRQ